MLLFNPKSFPFLSTTILCLVVVIFSQSFSCSSSQILTNNLDREPTTYEVLSDYNLPIGLLPKGVTSYDIDRTISKFSAFLNLTCSFSLEGSYQLRYKSTIKGFISKRKLSSLEGVSVKLFFIWIDIIEVSRRKDNLDFSVGITGVDFPIDNFEMYPQCGCGLNCGDAGKIIKLRTRSPFVSSS